MLPATCVLTTHICCEVEHPVGSAAYLLACVLVTQVHQDKLMAEFVLLHVLVAHSVCHQHVVAFLLQTLGHVRADEAATARHHTAQLSSLQQH